MNDQQLTPNDCINILNLVFQPDTPQKNVEDALKYIEENFNKQQNLVPIIVDFYINSEFAKPVIDLLCKVPDNLQTKVFDKLNDYLKTNYVKLDKIMALVYSLAYNSRIKSRWCSKFLQHQLFSSLLRSLNTKSNTPNATNEFITTQTCLLFVLLINVMPSQAVNSHQDMFQIVFNSYKSITSNEMQQHNKKNFETNANRITKWSIKLFLYVFYGIYPQLFLQQLRKKDNQTIHKDAINQILYQLRMHPALLKDKPETPSKPFDDAVFEWPQYCLDKSFTNFNRGFIDQSQTMHSNSSRILQSESSIPLSPSYSMSTSVSSKSTQELSSNDRHRNTSGGVLMHQTSASKATAQLSIPSTPLNNEFMLAKNTQMFQFPSNESLDVLLNANFTSSANESNAENTPNLSQQQQIFDLQIGSDMISLYFSGNEQKKPTKNLTAQFMLSSDEKQQQQEQLEIKSKSKVSKFPPLAEKTIRKIENLKQSTNIHSTNPARYSFVGNENLDYSTLINENGKISCTKNNKLSLSKHISLSDSNLNLLLSHQFYERRPKAQTAIGDPSNTDKSNNKEQQQKTTELTRQQLKFQKKIRSEMRDPTLILAPNISIDLNQYNSYSIRSNPDVNVFKKDFSETMSRQNSSRQYESNEILSSCISNKECSESLLKRELELLYHELLYERHLRSTYEKFLNEAYKMKTENEQLLQEKADLEILLKKAIESQKDSESLINKTLHQQFNACKQELQEKKSQLEQYKQKEISLQAKLKELEENFKEYKTNFQKLEKKLEQTEQALEKEQNHNKQNQNESIYIRALRNTTDDLRKKLLVMTKLSNKLSNNNPINNSKYLQLTTLYREEIDDLNRKLKDTQAECNRLLYDYKEKDLKINVLDKELQNKNKQIDELNQQISSTVGQINANLFKNNSRVYKSVLQINARLESEIIKLKSEIAELKCQLEQQKYQAVVYQNNCH